MKVRVRSYSRKGGGETREERDVEEKKRRISKVKMKMRCLNIMFIETDGYVY